MNMGVFSIYDRNTLYKIGDLKYNGKYFFKCGLGPRINGLVTDGKTNLCCRGFILALFQSTTTNEIDSGHTRDYKRLLLVCEAEILRVTVKRIEVFSYCNVDFGRFSAKRPKTA